MTEFHELLPAATSSPVTSAAAAGKEPGNRALGQQWHDIQAMFADDPRGSVQLAAQAADAAVSSLAASVRERQAGLRPTAGSAGTTEPSATEQLREALRTYRFFCEAVRDLAERLRQGWRAHSLTNLGATDRGAGLAEPGPSVAKF